MKYTYEKILHMRIYIYGMRCKVEYSYVYVKVYISYISTLPTPVAVLFDLWTIEKWGRGVGGGKGGWEKRKRKGKESEKREGEKNG